MDIALILFILTALTGALWAFNRFYARHHRAPGAPSPRWVEWGANFFSIFLLVFCLRSFVAEPFRIPSGSMIPTLLEGDFILVNKYTYGIRLPVIDRKIIDINEPRRGDIMVFRHPPKPTDNYIKRVVGLPGDKVEYVDKRLSINGEAIESHRMEDYLTDGKILVSQYLEKLGEEEHAILVQNGPSRIVPNTPFPHFQSCVYTRGDFSCIVPEGHYFVMGDNRDNSEDSRAWGFVPDANVVGKAFFIWFNWDFKFDRLGGIH